MQFRPFILSVLLISPILWAQPIYLTDESPSQAETTAKTESPPQKKVPALDKASTPEDSKNDTLKYFSAYRPVYFILWNNETDVKYQISFKYQIFSFDIPFLDDFFIAYTMLARWDLFEPSSPFREYNHQPELMFKPAFDLPLFKGLGISIIHNSNGSVGSADRAVDRIYADITLNFFILTIVPRYNWYINSTLSANNSDIAKHWGPYQLNAELPFIFSSKFTAEFLFTENFTSDFSNGGSLTVGFEIKVPLLKDLNPRFYCQYFTGKGQSLLAYNLKETQYRCGLKII